MKKICIVTATRAEYGYLKWLMKDIQTDSSMELQVVATGTHLDKTQGHTVDQIIADGIPVTAEVDVQLDNSSPKAICETMSRYGQGFAETLSCLNPDVMVVLGDRYELLPICSTAFMLQIPIAHLYGGDITEGALDDGVRNAVTMLANYHFASTDDCANNIKRMRGSDKNVFVIGGTSLDYFSRENLMTREQVAENLGLDINKKWVLCTLHSETKKTTDYNLMMTKNLFAAMKEKLNNYQIVITKANADFGGKEINDYIKQAVGEKSKQFVIIPSLGQTRYFSFMKQVEFIIGNSSSGITESPYLGVPTLNIGDRQKGRHRCKNILQCGTEKRTIENAINKICNSSFSIQSNYWGDGNATRKVLRKLKELI